MEKGLGCHHQGLAKQIDDTPLVMGFDDDDGDGGGEQELQIGDVTHRPRRAAGDSVSAPSQFPGESHHSFTLLLPRPCSRGGIYCAHFLYARVHEAMMTHALSKGLNQKSAMRKSPSPVAPSRGFALWLALLVLYFLLLPSAAETPGDDRAS